MAGKVPFYYLGPPSLFDSTLENYLRSLFERVEILPGIDVLHELMITKPNSLILLGIEQGDSYWVIEEVHNIQRMHPSSQILVISKEMDPQFLVKCLNSGIRGFVPYPVSMNHFQMVLRKSLQNLLAWKKFVETEQKKSKAQEASFRQHWLNLQLSVDQLTGLFNRTKLFEILGRQNELALILINLDNFSQLNLGYGYDFGDAVLRAVAEFLEAKLPANALGFRLQADEFAILLDNPEKNQEWELARQIHQLLPRLNVEVRGLAVKVSCSIGIARGKGYDLLRQANLALLEARSRGVGNIEVYRHNLPVESRQQENLFWITKIKTAFEKDGFFPVFQPILDNRTGKIHKFESLIRMRDEASGVIYPAQFLEAARLAGLLPLLTGAIVEKSLPYLQGNEFHISINVTSQDFRGLFLVDYLKRKIEELDIHPSRITLEILEEIEPSLNQLINEQLVELRRYGFRIAIDDFGVSASNFSRITELKPNYIKIDGRFISGVHRDPDLQKIVTVIQQISRSVGAEVIAEFVSNEADFEFIRKCGIEYSQGYFISEPLLEPKIDKINFLQKKFP